MSSSVSPLAAELVDGEMLTASALSRLAAISKVVRVAIGQVEDDADVGGVEIGDADQVAVGERGGSRGHADGVARPVPRGQAAGIAVAGTDAG